ncbi:paraquat-inducible protein A [Sodalis sp. C49]|uniref:paraquat-inducible protein A n=1 Tax=Sodalis sp. C49 TaxID=3228929 RepID=UPI003965C464
MKTFSHLIVCPYCDSVYRRRRLAAGEQARCTRCAAVLYRNQPVNVDRWLALTFTAGIAGVIANLYPVLTVSFHGVQNAATLWQAAMALSHGPTLPLALGILIVLIVAPLLQIIAFGWILLFIRRGQRAPGFIICMKLLLRLRPWSMVEVGMLGLVIAGIKLAGFLEVAPGPGCWALAVLMLLLIGISQQNINLLWTCPGRDRSLQAQGHD